MKNAHIKIIKASVIQVPHGADQINLTIAAPTAFPEAGYEVALSIEAAQGYGREWLKQVFGIELTAAHDRLAANPDMSVFERNLVEEPVKRKRAKKVTEVRECVSTYPPARVEDRVDSYPRT